MKPLTEMLGYQSDAALVAELREMIALNAAGKMLADGGHGRRH